MRESRFGKAPQTVRVSPSGMRACMVKPFELSFSCRIFGGGGSCRTWLPGVCRVMFLG